MATFYFRVYEAAAEVAIGHVQYGTVDIGVGSAQSVVIQGSPRQHRRVRIWADVDCFVENGVNPTATNDGQGGMPLGAENPEYVWVEAGEKFAVIQK